MAEILSTISIVSFVIAGVSFAVAILLWFLFDIPTVIGDLSGRTARKSIKRMREHNEKTGQKLYKSSKTNVARGRLTDTMPDSKELRKKSVVEAVANPETGLLAENKAESYGTEETSLLIDSEKITLLKDVEETSLLIDENETALLDETQDNNRVGGVKIVMLEEIMLIHTDEVI